MLAIWDYSKKVSHHCCRFFKRDRLLFVLLTVREIFIGRNTIILK